jgi:hypothetical protein
MLVYEDPNRILVYRRDDGAVFQVYDGLFAQEVPPDRIPEMLSLYGGDPDDDGTCDTGAPV